MNTVKLASYTTAESLGGQALKFALEALRIVVRALLEVLRPLAVLGLGVCSVLGFSMCAFVALFVRGSHFPMGTMLLLSGGSALGIVLHEALIFLLSKDGIHRP